MNVKRFGKLVALVVFVVAAASLISTLVRSITRTPGRYRGIAYRVLGHQPDPDVDDLTLADRVRSSLGPLEKRLDLPHVHVMVEDHVVSLHGDVEWPHEAAAIEHAVRHVSGVRGLESHLHIGLLRSDTRPSRGALRLAR